jgi:hypothetical protein
LTPGARAWHPPTCNTGRRIVLATSPNVGHTPAHLLNRPNVGSGAKPEADSRTSELPLRAVSRHSGNPVQTAQDGIDVCVARSFHETGAKPFMLPDARSEQESRFDGLNDQCLRDVSPDGHSAARRGAMRLPHNRRSGAESGNDLLALSDRSPGISWLLRRQGLSLRRKLRSGCASTSAM